MTDHIDPGPGGPPTTDELRAEPGVHSVLDERYELTEIIGRGGMGDVWEAIDRRLGRTVAVKILRSERHYEPEARRRFEHEARLAARIVNPHVVAVFDAGEHDSAAYLVMERLSGRTLADEIATGPLPPEQVRDLGRQILDALAAAHGAGLVHRDVKPANVLLAAEGWWKVGDFGIAKTLESSDPDTTAPGLVVGTPAYLAPERVSGARASAATDIFATGMVLYEALTGNRPARREKGAPPQSSATTPERLDVARPDAPVALTRTIMRALERDPSRRFATAAEMAAALVSPQALVDGLESGGTETVEIRPVVSAGPQGPPTMVAASVAPPLHLPRPAPRARRRILLWALFLGALAATAGALALGLGNGGGSSGGVTTTIPGGSVSTTTVSTTTVQTTTTRQAPTTSVPVTAPARSGKGPGHTGQGKHGKAGKAAEKD